MGEPYQVSIFDITDRREKYVRRIQPKEAIPFIMNVHYARRRPNITDAFGLFVDGEMVGVVTYGIPASAPLCRGIAGDENRYMVKELNRLVITPNHVGGVQNYASFLVAHSLKQLDNGTFVVSYADTAWSHVGYVYQACNFLYTGMSAKRNDTYQPDGLHPRAYNKECHSDLMQTRSPKHRYVYLVGDRRTKRRMLTELKYPIIKDYPKGDETRYNTENPVPVEPIRVMERKRG